jgi:hypothetical protein
MSGGASLLLVLLAAAISDAGAKLGLWSGPTVYFALSSVLVLLKITLPLSLLTGLVTAAAGQWNRGERD